MKSVMITGGAGFIGSWLAETLATDDLEKLVVVDNLFLGRKSNLDNVRAVLGERLVFHESDASNAETMKDIFFKEEPIDVVYDLAVKPLPVSFVDPTGVFDTSVKIAENLCALLRDGAFSELIHFSSCEVYGNAQKKRIDELHPLLPMTPYAAGKAAAESLVLSYHRTFGLHSMVIRPFNNYGPRQNEKMYAGLVPTTIKRILDGKEPFISGSGMQTRDYVYVKDCVKAAILLSKSKAAMGKAVNVGSGREVSVNWVVETISQLMRYKGKSVHGEERAGDFERSCGDTRLAESLISFPKLTPMREGLKDTIAYYERMSATAKK